MQRRTITSPKMDASVLSAMRQLPCGVPQPTQAYASGTGVDNSVASLKEGLELPLGRYFSLGDCSSCPFSCPLNER